MERHSRTILKTVSWRILATSTTLALVYFFTQNIFISASIGIAESTIKTVIYYLHERLWNKTSFGLKKSKSQLGPKQFATFIEKENSTPRKYTV